jgi:hypothetical protein
MESNPERLKDIFESMQKYGFKVDGYLKWGYFFIDQDKNKLLQVFEELKGHDYKLESLIKKDDEDEWLLNVSKVETLTPENSIKEISHLMSWRIIALFHYMTAGM